MLAGTLVLEGLSWSEISPIFFLYIFSFILNYIKIKIKNKNRLNFDKEQGLDLF